MWTLPLVASMIDWVGSISSGMVGKENERGLPLPNGPFGLGS